MSVVIGNRKEKLYIGNRKSKRGYLGGIKVYSAGNICTYHVDEIIYQEEVDEGMSVLAPASFTIPVKEGYTFAGWSLESGGSVISELVMGDEPVSLYGVWAVTESIINYTAVPVSFMARCGLKYFIEACGGQGESVNVYGTVYANGGRGGKATGYLVCPADTQLTVGFGNGGAGNSGKWDGAKDSFGREHGGEWRIGQGGHMAYVKTASGEYIIVAGGAGGGYAAKDSVDGPVSAAGGTGGGISGGDGTGNGNYNGGKGGTQSAHGVGVSGSRAGGAGAGYKNGGEGGNQFGNRAYGDSAGGGSGYIGGVTEGRMWNGVQSGNGYIKITVVH